MGYVKLVGSRNRHESWAAEYVLERGDDGNPTKVVALGAPVNLNKDEQEKLEALGAVFESSSQKEAEEHERAIELAQPVGADVAGSAPLLGDGGNEPNQATEPPASGKNDK